MVILSEAKNLVFFRADEILRFAQNDSLGRFQNRLFVS